ncbi:ureidoglycolate lyase [Mesorhizobium sp.]|uniref:ureidoglycolate lyase n=1 Tax=Mesorhizobium sp. TaxID=1871066 RepID=UPI000FE55F81|nr:ureidoglycolate lyase [Mesorhizobium sp.]RWI88915.1 MAG: ureidoglycolate lyase [Mesorhizobium sp.]
MASSKIALEPLTKAAFRSFGDVIERDPLGCYETNDGEALRHHDLARIDVTAAGGRVAVSIFQVMIAATLPFPLRLMERHPISSQAFVPLGPSEFVVVVAPRARQPSPENLRAFLASAGQGINLHAGVWHHPLIALTSCDFLVLDRTLTGDPRDQDYEEIRLETERISIVRRRTRHPADCLEP